MTVRAVIFLGPSMPVQEAKRILPGALYRPPARQSDLISSVRIDQPQVIGLIDGTFAQTLSVWHKEILYALERGVHVYGASSMGALRAAECERFGMVGVGAIFQSFATGELTDDDEVALAHAGADEGWRALTEPMVDVRATLSAARDRQLLDDDQVALIATAAKRIYFAERTWGAIVAGARDGGLAEDACAKLERWARESPVRQKRADAVQLLEAIAALPDDLPAAAPTERLARSHTFLALLDRDRRVGRAAGEVSLEAVARYAMLHHADAETLMADALHRSLASVFADFLHLEVEDSAVDEEERRFRAARHLADEASMDAWRAANDLDQAEFRELMQWLAISRRLRRWLLARRFKRRGVKPLLDELRVRGLYPGIADAAASYEAALARLGEGDGTVGGLPRDITRRELIASHSGATGWLPDTSIEEWASESGFEDGFDVYLEMLRSRRLRSDLGPAGAPPTPGPAGAPPTPGPAGAPPTPGPE